MSKCINYVNFTSLCFLFQIVINNISRKSHISIEQSTLHNFLQLINKIFHVNKASIKVNSLVKDIDVVDVNIHNY